MLDIEFIRNNKTRVEKAVIARGHDEAKVGQALTLDEKRRASLKEVEELRAERNIAAKERNIEQGKKLKDKLEEAEAKLKKIEVQFNEVLLSLPNLPLPEVPVGDPTKATVIAEEGSPRKFSFKPKDHLELGERLGIIDMQSAAKVSGARFTYLKGKAALLELALINFAMSKLVKEGFTPIFPPALIKQEITSKLGYWQAGGNENYYLVSDLEEEESNPLYLIGTGEHATVPIHWKDIIPTSDLPKRYAALSPCFRREAGTYGKDTRGIIRVHQFDKVEMVSFCKPEDAEKEFEKLINIPWKMMTELKLPVRKVMLASEDLGFPLAKTVDIETWFPSQASYRETHSISTATDFQARRLETRYLDQGKTGFVHILNGTAFAIGRTLAAILENYQKEDGSVEVPKALRAFVGFDVIKSG